MIIVFDLDDTLYEEITFVHSGFRAVAEAVSGRWPISAESAFEFLMDSIKKTGRGRQFDDLLDRVGARSRRNIEWLLRVYRHHPPDISLTDDSLRVLESLSGKALYLVTDGHKVVQNNKIEALGLRRFFRHCYLTHRYGVCHRKPSPRVFELLLERENSDPDNVVYVGDDPRKDFRGIRPLGFRTIRVGTGRCADIEVAPDFDAEIRVDRLPEIIGVVAAWEDARRERSTR